MKKVVVLGCVGMAGHIMAEHLDSAGGYNVLGVARGEGKYVTDKLDVSDSSALHKFLEKTKPDYVINCIGVLVGQSSNDICTAIQINSYLPHFLSKLGRSNDFKLIHISTDCVFSGKDGQYQEASFKDGDDNYARSKALGEVDNDKDLTIRTSIIGPELKTDGTGLLDWFLKQNAEIKGYTEAYWSGVTTLELAKATEAFIGQGIAGVYQLCPTEKISKYGLLKLFSKVWDRGINVMPFDGYKVDKSLVCTRSDFNYSVPRYEDMLEQLLVWMKAHPVEYSHYQI